MGLLYLLHHFTVLLKYQNKICNMRNGLKIFSKLFHVSESRNSVFIISASRFQVAALLTACIITQIKHPTRCNNQSQNLLLCRTDTAQHVSGITMPIIRSPSNCRSSLWFPSECGLTNRPRLRTLPPPHSYGNQRLQRQFDGLLMMSTVMPETC